MTIKLFKKPQATKFPYSYNLGPYRIIFKQYYSNGREPSWSYKHFKDQAALERFIRGDLGDQAKFVYKAPRVVFFEEMVSHFAREATQYAVAGIEVSACTLSFDLCQGAPLEYEFAALDEQHLEQAYQAQVKALSQSRDTEAPSP
jgi:hypothetical protein